MSKTKSQHYNLCLQAAKWLQSVQGCKYVAIELITYGGENPDVWGTPGWNSHIIEVKTSRSDYLKDRKKECRQPGKGMGNFRYYLLPEGAVKPEEVPEDWGILYHNGEKITQFQRQPKHRRNMVNEDISMLCSIMRREGIKKQIFNYRNQNPIYKSKSPEIEGIKTTNI